MPTPTATSATTPAARGATTTWPTSTSSAPSTSSASASPRAKTLHRHPWSSTTPTTRDWNPSDRSCPHRPSTPSLPKLERLRAISTWLASSWEHTPAAPGLGVINSPWDPETVLAWAPGQCGHNGLRPTANCIFYGVAFANAAQAIGVPARCAIFAGKPGKADGHFTAEYWLEEHQKWAMVDPNFDDFFLRDGVPLSVDELQVLGSDLEDVTERGPGAESQRPNQRVHRWFDSHERRARSLEFRTVWYRADQLTRPEFSPPAHGGGGAYTETGIVWEERDKDTWPMFPHFGSKDYFNAPPVWEG